MVRSLPPGFTYRTGANGPYAVRTFIDWPLALPDGSPSPHIVDVLVKVAALTAEESKSMGAPVSAQSILRRAVDYGLFVTGDEEDLLRLYRCLSDERKQALTQLLEGLFHLPEGASGAYVVTLQPPVRSITVHPTGTEARLAGLGVPATPKGEESS
jgi:hypothetical protein